MTRESAVRIAVVLPELLGTYGDSGNGIVLEHRLRWRGIAVERIECAGAASIPETRRSVPARRRRRSPADTGAHESCARAARSTARTSAAR